MEMAVFKALSDNFRFLITEGENAAAVDPSDAGVVLRARAVFTGDAMFAGGCGRREFAAAAGLAGNSPDDVFADLRRRKDSWG